MPAIDETITEGVGLEGLHWQAADLETYPIRTIFCTRVVVNERGGYLTGLIDDSALQDLGSVCVGLRYLLGQPQSAIELEVNREVVRRRDICMRKKVGFLWMTAEVDLWYVS